MPKQHVSKTIVCIPDEQYEVALKEGDGLIVIEESIAIKDGLRMTDPDKEQSFHHHSR